MAQINTQTSAALTGQCSVPGDKAISHRAIIFGGIAEGETTVRNLPNDLGCRATVGVMRDLGVEIETPNPTDVVIHGRGLDGLQEPRDVLNCAESATTLRLLTGLLAGQQFASFLTGGPRLRRHSFAHVINPLRGMGADLMGRQNGTYAPLGIRPVRLRSVEYEMPVANAQAKSGILLAGMYAKGLTIVHEPIPTRDHTERLLRAMGASIDVIGRAVYSERPSAPLRSLNLRMPGDISAAAALLVAAAIVPGSRVTIAGVGINPTRIGIVEALAEMGAEIRLHNERDAAGEPVADLEVRHSDLRAVTFGGPGIITMLDELLVLAVAATQARGRTLVRDAAALRVTETDRIASAVGELRKMGARIEPTSDGFLIDGPTPLKGAPVESQGDPQLAMALTVAGLVATGKTTIYGSEIINTAFPEFVVTLQALGASLTGGE